MTAGREMWLYSNYIGDMMLAVRTVVNKKSSKRCMVFYDTYDLLD